MGAEIAETIDSTGEAMQLCQLTFWIWSERLTGAIGDYHFSMRAVSGGGRGGKAPQHGFGSYDPYTNTDKQAGIRGGTIPPGYYLVEPPSQYKGSMHGRPISRLQPIYIDEPGKHLVSDEKTPYGRDFEKAPFLIHGPGTKGSDGCIVIEKVPRSELLAAVESSTDPVVLRVTPEDRDGRVLSPLMTA